MVPATELIVHWFDWQSARDRQSMLHVGAAGENLLVPLRPEVVAWHGAGRPALVGRSVVRREAIHVECLGVDGIERWSRRITPEGPRTVVVVDSAR
jgi:hypothetical protein